jgi:outer membrane protein assembly factor BamD
MRPGRRAALVGGALLLSLGFDACGTGGQPDIATLASNSDQVIWEAGQKAFEKKQWDSARQHFKRIIDAFPQSEYGPAARLGVGDAYFNEGGTANYVLAISAYREFLTLYPSHPKSDYALFQSGEANFKQRNGPDRDQTATIKALEEFERLLELYPNSQYVEKTRSRIMECRQSLARAEFLAGLFYQKTRQACRAAIARFERVVSEFADFQQLDEVLYRLGACLQASGRGAEAAPYLDRLVQEYPQSEFADDARRLLKTLPGPAASPSPAAPSTVPSAAPSPEAQSGSTATPSPPSTPSPRPTPRPTPGP